MFASESINLTLGMVRHFIYGGLILATLLGFSEGKGPMDLEPSGKFEAMISLKAEKRWVGLHLSLPSDL